MTNQPINFQPAQKSKCKLRCAIFGPSGSGKTFSALRIATGMGGRIAVIDTEFGSASKYADRFRFDTVSLASPDIDTYIQAMVAAQNYDVLIIDSLSHGWQELLQEIDQLAKTKFKGNSWGAWSEGTPKQRKLVEFIQSFPGHVIGTMRSKTEWQTESANNGKMKPVRVGLTPEQGKGIEYEFDLLLELNTEHFCTVIKDRTGKFQDKIVEKPGENFGKELIAWLNGGAAAVLQGNAYGQPAASAAPPPPAAILSPDDFYAKSAQPPAPAAPAASVSPQSNIINPPLASPQAEEILRALADYYKMQSHPVGYVFDEKKMRQAILNRYGRYPTLTASVATIKQQITPFDTQVQVAA